MQSKATQSPQIDPFWSEVRNGVIGATVIVVMTVLVMSVADYFERRNEALQENVAKVVSQIELVLKDRLDSKVALNNEILEVLKLRVSGWPSDITDRVANGVQNNDFVVGSTKRYREDDTFVEAEVNVILQQILKRKL